MKSALAWFRVAFVHLIPVLAYIGGLMLISSDQMMAWNYSILFLIAVGWGYARGRATEEIRASSAYGNR